MQLSLKINVTFSLFYCNKNLPYFKNVNWYEVDSCFI